MADTKAPTVPDGSLPGASGTSIGLSSFNVRASAPNGDVVFDFLSGRDFGALYFDFFGPGTGDGFVFINALRGAVHLQVAVPTGFTGTGPIGSAAIFGGVGGPVGQIDGKSGVAYVPLPAPAVLLLAAITALGFVAARRRASPRGMRAA